MYGGSEAIRILWVFIFMSKALGIDVLNTRFVPDGAAYFTDTGFNKETSIYTQNFASVGNVDYVSLSINIGNLWISESISSDFNFRNQPLTTVHLFQKELREDDPTLHLLCHSLVAPDLLKALGNQQMSTCCIIKVVASNQNFFTGCLIDNLLLSNRSTCHASMRIERRAWNDSLNNELDVSYRINNLRYSKSATTNLLMDSTSLSRQCLTPLATQMTKFKFLSKISLKKPQHFEIREIGRNIQLDIPSRWLKNGEYFTVPVRVKQQANIAEFTLRCEIPWNTYVEFIRVVWSWEADEYSYHGHGTNDNLFQRNDGFSAWDISQRHISSLKGNVTEIVARYRDTAIDSHLGDHSRDVLIIYKLLFRVTLPSKDSAGRIGPRFLWSLASLSRRNTADQSVSGSPVVTRLNIESTEFKHLVVVIKSNSFINTAALSGYPVYHPVWVFGLNHRLDLIDVTARATCHTGDEVVAHFPRDSCTVGLTFSGGELGGSDALCLVAKVDQTSAEESVVVWFPQQPRGVSLVIDNPRGGPSTALFADASTSGPNPLHEYSTASIILRALTDSHQSAQRPSGPQGIGSAPNFQQTRLRVFARFTTANPRMTSTSKYAHSSNEGFTSPALDVTDLTAHCLRLEVVKEPHTDNNMTIPTPLVIVSEANDFNKTGNVRTSTTVWLAGRRSGRVRLKLTPAVYSPHVKAALPTALARMQLQQDQAGKQSVGGGALWEARQFQTLWVTVTDSERVWPVGITAQLVTDITVTVSLKDFPQTQEQEKVEQEKGFTLYTALIRFSGSRVGRSMGSPTGSNSGPTSDAFSFQRENQFSTPKRSKRQATTKTLPRQGLLVVTIQFSDGSVLPWHRLMEVAWELGESKAPFTLMVKNLRPDLVSIDMPTFPPSPSASSLHQTPSVASQWPIFHLNDSAAGMKNKRPEWLGPKVFLLREDESFIGDLLRVMLLSNIDNSLLFSAPVHASIVAARPSRRHGEEDVVEARKTTEASRSFQPRVHSSLEGIDGIHDAESRGVGGVSLTNDQFDHSADASVARGPQWKRVEDREWDHSTHAFEMSQSSSYDTKGAELYGSPALKDAPGMRSKLPRYRPSYSDHIDKASSKARHQIKETDVSVDRPNADSGLNEVTVKHSGAIEGEKNSFSDIEIEGIEHRPTLEFIMYILIGLFVLIALIFAVNCGAMVARYRCEQARGAKENLRLQRLSELAMSSTNIDAAVNDECSSSSIVHLQSQGDHIGNMNGMLSETKTTWHRKCLSAFAALRRRFVLRNSSQQHTNKDGDWIWVGREVITESQHNTGTNSQTGSRLATVTNSDYLSKNPCLPRPLLTPTTSNFSTSTAFAKSNYEGEECSIQILTNTVELDKSEAALAAQQLHLSTAGLQQKTLHHSRNHQRTNQQEHNGCHHSHLDHRRRSELVFGQSLILDQQNPDWQFAVQCGLNPSAVRIGDATAVEESLNQGCTGTFHSLEPQRRRRSRWELGCRMPPTLSVEGYLTLPSHMSVWQDGSDYGAPPCPPLRTSSKLKPPPLLPPLASYDCTQDTSTVIPRPNGPQLGPYLVTSVTNEIYSLSSVTNDSATLVRQPSTSSYSPPRTLRHWARSCSRFDTNYQSPPMVPQSQCISTRCRQRAQCDFRENRHHCGAYVNCRPASGTSAHIRSITFEPIS